MRGLVLAVVGRHPTLFRVIGASLLAVIASVLGVRLALYSQSMVNLEPQPVSSVMVGVLEPSTGQTAVEAISVIAHLSDVSGEQQGDVDMSLRVRVSGAETSSTSVLPRFVLGGELVAPSFSCENVPIETVDFVDLSVPEQTAALLSIEDQLRRLQSLRSVSAAELSAEEIRETAYSMSYAVVYPRAAAGESWNQSWPDDLRTLPLDSADSPEPAEKELTGTQWSLSCRGGSATHHETTWGKRIEFPAVGVLLPPSLSPIVPAVTDGADAAGETGGLTGTAGTVNGIPVETKTSVTSAILSTDLERVGASEGKFQNTMMSETQRTDQVSSTELLGDNSGIFIDDSDSSSAQSASETDSRYLSAARFSLRYSTAWFRASSQVSLFACGVLFSLAATLLIAVTKTMVREILGAPKL